MFSRLLILLISILSVITYHQPTFSGRRVLTLILSMDMMCEMKSILYNSNNNSNNLKRLKIQDESPNHGSYEKEDQVVSIF